MAIWRRFSTVRLLWIGFPALLDEEFEMVEKSFQYYYLQWESSLCREDLWTGASAILDYTHTAVQLIPFAYFHLNFSKPILDWNLFIVFWIYHCLCATRTMKLSKWLENQRIHHFRWILTFVFSSKYPQLIEAIFFNNFFYHSLNLP